MIREYFDNVRLFDDENIEQKNKKDKLVLNDVDFPSRDKRGNLSIAGIEKAAANHGLFVEWKIDNHMNDGKQWLKGYLKSK